MKKGTNITIYTSCSQVRRLLTTRIYCEFLQGIDIKQLLSLNEEFEMDKTVYLHRLKVNMQGKYESEYIDRCVFYAESLLDRNLPVIFDMNHIYAILQLGCINLDWYNDFGIKRRNGTVRIISAPSRPLKYRQRWILDEILSKIEIMPCCEGFTKGHSIVTNASKHIGYAETLTVDMKDFFPSIKEKQIVDVFREVGYTQEVAVTLSSLCCHEGCLPQGAPTSPQLSNIICKSLDRDLIEFSKKYGLVYSRYADDLTFSGNQDLNCTVSQIKGIIQNHGFRINDRKTRLYTGKYRRIVTGLIVTEHGLRVPREYKRKLRQEIYYCKKFGVTQHLKNTNSSKVVNFKEFLYGKAYYIKMVEPKTGKKFLEQLDEIEW